MSVDLIYGDITGLLRRVVVSSLPHLHVQAGETAVTITDRGYAEFTNLNQIQEYINSVTGREPGDYHAVMIDGVGNVLSTHNADPGCDPPFPGYDLRWHPSAAVGWLFVNRQFVPLPAARRRNFRSPRLLRFRTASA